jgi:hypothetical protein
MATRCKRGDTFKIIIQAMVAVNVLGRWSARKYREARDLLLELGLIREVVPETGACRAEYVLADRILTPSLDEGCHADHKKGVEQNAPQYDYTAAPRRGGAEGIGMTAPARPRLRSCCEQDLARSG